jgi:hypothetical protein
MSLCLTVLGVAPPLAEAVPQHLLADPAYRLLVGPELAVAEHSVQPQSSPGLDGIASNGQVYLVVWQDNDPSGVAVARVSVDGALLDRPRIFLGYSYRTLVSSVASNGEDFLVVIGVLAGASEETVGVRISGDGQILDRRPLPIGAGEPAAVASDGDGYLVVVKSGTDEGETLTAVRLDGNGMVLDQTPILGSTQWIRNVDVAWNGRTYLVSWFHTSTKRIQVALMPPGGPASKPIGVAELTDEYPNSSFLASAGGAYLLVWEDPPQGEYVGPTYASVISSRGRVMTPDPLILVEGGTSSQNITSNGETYLVTYRYESRDVAAVRVTPEGEVIDDRPLILLSDPQAGRLLGASNGEDFFVAWGTPHLPSGLAGVRVSASGQVLDRRPIQIAYQVNEQDSPGVAFGGSTYLTAWLDGRTGGKSVFASRMSATGDILDGAGFIVGKDATHQVSPKVAGSGAGFLIAWVEPNSHELVAARVTSEGVLVDVAPIQFGEAGLGTVGMSIASDGKDFLMVWTSLPRVGKAFFYGIVIPPSGKVPEPFPLPGATAVAWNGAEYLVSWGSDYDIRATRLSPSGEMLDATPLRITHDGYTTKEIRPSVASDGDRFLVVWRNRHSRSTALSAAIVGPDGTVEKRAILPAPFQGMKYSQHQVAWDGSSHVVAYTVCAGNAYDCRHGRSWDVSIIRVAADGTVLDDQPVKVDDSSFPEQHPAITTGPDGALLVYDRYAADTRTGGVTRVFARLLRG